MSKQGGDKGEKTASGSAQRESVLAKEKKAKEAVEKKAAVLAGLIVANDALDQKSKELKASGKKIDDSVERDITLNKIDFSKPKTSSQKEFSLFVANIESRIKRINEKLVAPSADENQESDKLHQDIKKLEVEAASEDKEFAVNTNHYTAAQAELGLLFGVIKNNNLELDESGQEKEERLQTLLVELLKSLTETPPQYDKFKKTLHDFRVAFNLFKFKINKQLNQAETTLPELEQELPEKQPEPKKKAKISPEDLEKLRAIIMEPEKQPEKEKEVEKIKREPNSAKASTGKEKAEEVQRKPSPDWEKRKHLYHELKEKFLTLEQIIEKGVKNKPAEYFYKDLDLLEGYLENAKDADVIKEFDDNIRKFEKLLSSINAEIKYIMDEAEKSPTPEIAKEEEKINPKKAEEPVKEVVPVVEEQIIEEKKAEPVIPAVEVAKPAAVVEKEDADIAKKKDFIAKEKARLKILKEVLKDSRPESHTAYRVDTVLHLLAQAEENLTNEPVYREKMAEEKELNALLWQKSPKEQGLTKEEKKEYQRRLHGEKTDVMLKEEEERRDEIKMYEDSVGFIEQRVGEGLRKKFTAQINSAKDYLNEALNHLEDEGFWMQTKIKFSKELAPLLKEMSRELRDEYGKQFLAAYEIFHNKLMGKTEVASAVVPAVVSGEINNAEAAHKLPTPSQEESWFKSFKPAAEPSAPVAPKKGLWDRFKGGVKQIFNRETGKVAGKVGYDSITSVLGIKLITDALGAIKGRGDIAEWWKGRKESKSTRDALTMAHQDLMESFDKVKGNKVLAENEKIENRIANFKAIVESAKISPEAKKALMDRVWEISLKHKEDTAAAFKERDKEMQRTLEAYFQPKVSGMKNARAAMNLALTAAGFSALRAIMYAGASLLERGEKAKREHVKQTLDAGKKEESKFVAKDFAKAAIETAHALIGQAGKKDVGGVKRTIDAVKAWGVVLRGFGIYGVAISGAELPQQSFDRLISGIKEHGIAGAVSENFLKNVEHIGQNAVRVEHGVESSTAHLNEVFTGNTNLASQIAEHHEASIIPEYSSGAETLEVPEVSAGFSVGQFSVEHNLSPEFARSLDNLVRQYPELNNPDSIGHILNASQVGGGAHSHHDAIKSAIDTLDEGGGERRQVIFEELLKNGSPQSAADYLESQHFSFQHLSHLPGKYVHDGKLDYEKFVQDYNEKDNKMVRGLFGAMQGRESTDLANAKLEGHGIDSHARGKINYFGVENKKPVLSGSGEVRVVEESFVTRNKIGNAAAQNEGLSTDDKLWANANVIRSMNGGAAYEGSSANAPAESMSAEERAVLAEVEGDKERFARLGERHIDILDTARSGKPVGEYINNTTQPEAPGAEPAPATTESVAVRKIINTFKASEVRPVVEAKPVVPVVEKPLPEEIPVTPEPYAGTPLSQLLEKNGSNPKEFFDTVEKMNSEASKYLDNTFIYEEGSYNFFDKKIHNFYEATDMNQVEKVLHSEELYKSGNKDWMKDWSKAMFDKDDSKAMQLAFSAHKDIDSHPVLTNNSHAVRIWNAKDKKDVFWYDESRTFNLDKKGNLVMRTDSGKETLTQEEALAKAGEM